MTIDEMKNEYFLSKDDLRSVNMANIWSELDSNPSFVRKVFDEVITHINKKEADEKRLIVASSIEHEINQIGLSKNVKEGICVIVNPQTGKLRIKCL